MFKLSVMSIDVNDLYQFYHTPLGRLVAADLCRLVNHLWSKHTEKNIISFGFGFPILNTSHLVPSSIIALTPDYMGGMLWPHHEGVQTAIVHETDLPLLDQSIDRFLLLHALEYSTHPHELLLEIFRVLKPNGELLIIVPNRRGLWAHHDHTPFGRGRPYTMTQLSHFLKEHSFEILQHERAIFMPPWSVPKFLKPMFDVLGSIILRKFSGVIAIQAKKVLFSSIPNGHVQSRAHQVWLPDMVVTP